LWSRIGDLPPFLDLPKPSTPRGAGRISRAQRRSAIEAKPTAIGSYTERRRLPSLICDGTDRWLVVQLMSAGLEACGGDIVDALQSSCVPWYSRTHDVSLRAKEGLPQDVELFAGRAARDRGRGAVDALRPPAPGTARRLAPFSINARTGEVGAMGAAAPWTVSPTRLIRAALARSAEQWCGGQFGPRSGGGGRELPRAMACRTSPSRAGGFPNTSRPRNASREGRHHCVDRSLCENKRALCLSCALQRDQPRAMRLLAPRDSVHGKLQLSRRQGALLEMLEALPRIQPPLVLREWSVSQARSSGDPDIPETGNQGAVLQRSIRTRPA